MDDIEHVCDRVIVINHGEKVYDDYLSGLLSQYKSTKYIRVYFEILPKDLTSLGNVAHVESLKEDSVVFEVEKSRQSEFLAKITQDFKVDDIDILSIPLEEIIEDIFKKSNIPLSLNDN